MGDLSVNELAISALFLLGIQTVIFLTFLIVKQKLTKTRFLRFLGVFGIAFACSFFPLLAFGALFGFPSVLLASILIAIFLDKDD